MAIIGTDNLSSSSYIKETIIRYDDIFKVITQCVVMHSTVCVSYYVSGYRYIPSGIWTWGGILRDKERRA